MIRTPKYYRTPLSKKQENIQAFGRLIELAKQKRYRGPRLGDQTIDGLTNCVSTFLSLNGLSNTIKGNTVEISFDDGSFTIVIAGTHKTFAQYPPAVYSDDHELTIYNLMSLVTFFDENF